MSAPRNPLVAIVLLTLNQREKTLRCLESLARVTFGSFRVVVWDNGSTDGTVTAIRERFPEVAAHHSPTNFGVASGRNAAAQLAVRMWDPRFFCFLDNDMTVEPDFLDHLVRPFQGDVQLAVSTGKIRCLGDEARLYGAAGCLLDFRFGRTGHIGHGEIDVGQYDERRDCLASGGCMCVSVDVFTRLDGFDSAFDPYGPEDLDFGLRVRAIGMRIRYVPNAVMYHEPEPGHTFGGGMKSTVHVRNKARLWFVLMRRHAPAAQQLFFVVVGAPWTLGRMLWREIRRGNVRVLAGLVSGLADSWRPSRAYSASNPAKVR
jgi:GT2 family glycosyltransferase